LEAPDGFDSGRKRATKRRKSDGKRERRKSDGNGNKKGLASIFAEECSVVGYYLIQTLA